jgi:CDP-diacylglycerol--serine O-phosphatidyltransferase
VLSALLPIDAPPPSDVKHFPNPTDTPTVRRASLFRSFVLADYITCANAVCGVGSIFLCLNYLGNDKNDAYLWWAFALLPFALLFDIMDGWVARKRQSFSPWGSDLDSLADVVSFVVCPAVLGFTLGLRGMWDTVTLCFFVFCGIARLARFNVTSSMLATGTKVPYYEGFPVPTSLLLVAMWAWAWTAGATETRVWGGVIKVLSKDFHPLVLIYAVWGCLFVSSSVRIPKP